MKRSRSSKKSQVATKSHPQKKKAVKRPEKLSLYDRLSHLTYRQACGLLGEEGAVLLRRSYDFDQLDAKRDIYLGDGLFRLSIHEYWTEPATVTIMLAPAAKFKLGACCSLCNPQQIPNRYCEHIAATLSLILEEKTLIGLADVPDLETPAELLSEKRLRERALHERRERARTEKYRIKPVDQAVAAKTPWTDYLVASELSGKTYRVALRGTEPGDSYCSCPDFKTNRLGTCKHLIALLHRMEKKFDKKTLASPFVNDENIVFLRYGEERTLHFDLADGTETCDCDNCTAVMKISRNFLNRPIDNIPRLLNAISKLEAIGQSVTIYPDAEDWIREKLHQNHIAELVAEIRANPKKHPLRKTLLATELLPYQLDGIAFAVGAGRAILADDMGLGKTIQGIGVAELLAREAQVEKVLIVCPASVKSQWRSEIMRFAPHRSVQVVMGGADERFDQYGNEAFFSICNYEQVLRDQTPIEQTRWDLIILDEGQRIKNWGAKTTQAVKSLRSTFALILSGTPMENRLDELYSVVQFVDDRRLLPAYRFFHRHRIVEDTGRVAGYKNLDELREQLKPILLRRTKESVMLELPERSTEIIRIAPTAEQSAMHAGHMMTVAQIVRKPYISEMDLLRLQKALLAARMSADSTELVDKHEPGFSSKLERLEELLEELLAEPERKIVLFSEWTRMLDLIEPIVERNGAEFVRLDGKVPQKKRQALVRQFMTDPDCRMFLTTNAGSVGLNLQAADTVVNVDLPWNPAVLEQRIGRAHRMGQKRHVQVFLLITEQTIEEDMLKTLSAKQDLALASLDIGSKVSEVMMKSGVEELKRRLEVLLGSKSAAPVDKSVRTEAGEHARDVSARKSNTEHTIEEKQEQIVQSGTEVLGAVFKFLGALTGQPAETTPTVSPNATSGHAANAAAENTTAMSPVDAVVPAIRQAVSESVRIESDDQGKVKLSLTLPDQPVLENLIQNATRLFAGFLDPKNR